MVLLAAVLCYSPDKQASLHGGALLLHATATTNNGGPPAATASLDGEALLLPAWMVRPCYCQPGWWGPATAATATANGIGPPGRHCHYKQCRPACRQPLLACSHLRVHVGLPGASARGASPRHPPHLPPPPHAGQPGRALLAHLPPPPHAGQPDGGAWLACLLQPSHRPAVACPARSRALLPLLRPQSSIMQVLAKSTHNSSGNVILPNPRTLDEYTPHQYWSANFINAQAAYDDDDDQSSSSIGVQELLPIPPTVIRPGLGRSMQPVRSVPLVLMMDTQLI